MHLLHKEENNYYKSQTNKKKVKRKCLEILSFHNNNLVVGLVEGSLEVVLPLHKVVSLEEIWGELGNLFLGAKLIL